MHLVAQKIKDAWRKKNIASILFLDTQAAFPNTVKDRLLHNMKTRHVPTSYICLFDCMLSNQQMHLRFDNFLSKPIDISNSTTQGCPLSMLLYTFYNADLIDIVQGKNELSTGFVDDCAFVAIGKTLNDTHNTLKDMMEWIGGRLKWSHCHNSLFKLSKLAIMDFPRPHIIATSSPLIINMHHPNSTMTSSTVTNVQSYKYLGVIFEPKLSWQTHVTKVVASATCWTQQLWCVSKTARGLLPNRTCQLYNTIVVPTFTYTSDI